MSEAALMNLEHIKVKMESSHDHGPWHFECMQSLCDRYDFVFIQEHWLINKQSHMFVEKLTGINPCCTSEMNDNELLVSNRPPSHF